MQNIEELIQLLNLDPSLLSKSISNSNVGSSNKNGINDKDGIITLNVDASSSSSSPTFSKNDFNMVKLPISLPLLDQLNSLKSISPLPSSPNLFSTVFSTASDQSNTDSDSDSTPKLNTGTTESSNENEYETKISLINELVDKIISKHISKSIKNYDSLIIDFQYPINDPVLSEKEIKETQLNSDQTSNGSGNYEDSDDLILGNSRKAGSSSSISNINNNVNGYTKYKVNWKSLIVKLHQLIIQSGLYHNLLKKISNQNTSTQLESSQTLLAKDPINKINTKQVSLSSNELIKQPPTINISSPQTNSNNNMGNGNNHDQKDNNKSIDQKNNNTGSTSGVSNVAKSTPVSPLYSSPTSPTLYSDGSSLEANNNRQINSNITTPTISGSGSNRDSNNPTGSSNNSSTSNVGVGSTNSSFSLSSLMGGNKNNIPKSLRELEERSLKVDQIKFGSSQSSQPYSEPNNPNMNKLPTSYETDPVLLPDGSEFSNVKPISTIPTMMSGSIGTMGIGNNLNQISPNTANGIPIIIGSAPTAHSNMNSGHGMLSGSSGGMNMMNMNSMMSPPSLPSSIPIVVGSNGTGSNNPTNIYSSSPFGSLGSTSMLSTSSGMPPTRLTESFFPTSSSRGPPSYDSNSIGQQQIPQNQQTIPIPINNQIQQQQAQMLSISPSPSTFMSNSILSSSQGQIPNLSSNINTVANTVVLPPQAINISSSPIIPPIDTMVPASSSFKGHTSTPQNQGQNQMQNLSKPISGLNEIYSFPEWLDISIYFPKSGKCSEILNEQQESSLSDNGIMLDIQSLLLSEKSIGRLDQFLESKLISIINEKLLKIIKMKSVSWLETIYNYWIKSVKLDYFKEISSKFKLILLNFNNKIWNKEKYDQVVNRIVNLRRVYPSTAQPTSTTLLSSNAHLLFSKRPLVAQVNSQQEEQEMISLMKRIEDDALYLITVQNQQSLRWIEKLVIGLLGHTSAEIRQSATRLLNVIYDSHSWQLEEPLKSVIRVIGDAFKIELELESPLPEEVLKRVFVLTVVPPTQRLSQSSKGTNNTSQNTLFIRHKVKLDQSRLHLELPSFYRAGYYDWRIVELDSNGNYQPFDYHNHPIRTNTIGNQITLPNELIQGRFIVHPRLREEIMHEVWVDLQDSVWDPNRGEMVKKGTIQNLIDSLDHYHQDGITTLYVMGLLEKLPNNQPLCPTDRDLPNRGLGGIPLFNKLIQRAKQLNIKIVIDSTSRLSSKSPHRKYNGVVCHQINENSGQLGRAEGTDSAEFTWPDTLLMNMRKLSVWEMYVSETLLWGDRGIDGVRIDSAHICPLIIRPNLDELYRLDSDDLPHYTNQQIFDGEIIQKPSEEGKNFGYWGTTPPSPKHSSPFYPNPLFIKMTREVWHRHPQFVFLAEVYWERELHSIISGLVPYSSAIPKALASVFDKGISKDGVVFDLRQRQNVKALYDYYEMRMTTYPQNSIILFPSSTHHSPYPLSIYNAGAWAAVDMLYFLPEIPITYIGEQSGWYYPVDIQTSRVKIGMSSTPYQLQYPQIRGHYQHRVTLRKTHSLLRRGGMIPLLCYHQNGWHDRVFGFARFSGDEVAIIAINFDNHETEFYVDCSPLAKISTEDSIYRMVDLINPSNPPQYLSLTELLYEKHFVQVPGFSSICWGIYHQVSSPAAVRVLYEHSITRLKQLLADDVDPSHNLIYSMLKKSLTTSVDAFSKALENILSNLSGNTEKSFSLFIQSVLYQMTKSFDGYKILSYLTILSKQSPSPRIQKICKETIQHNILGPIVFITPEIGRFSTVGGVGVMLDELTRSLQLLGCEVHIISPYYNYGKGGRTGYLEKEEGIKWQRNVITYVGPDRVEVGVHEGSDKGIHLHFLHHFDYFPTPYNAGSSVHQLKTIVLFAKASLELLCQIRLIPSVIVTNDWFCGLVPGYAKSGAFGTTFNGTTLFHLVHNLEEAYQGRIYPDGGVDDLNWIHHLHRDLIVDPFSHQLCLNASRCALMSSNNWGTVSKSYLYDLLRTSHLASLLHRFPQAFAHSNGIRVKDRTVMMEKVAPSHDVAKAELQKKYFGVADPTIPVFSFVGRIVLQKGVHLILNAVRELIQHYGGKIQILIGGMANMKDPYASSCAWSMQALSKQFPTSFWADPDAFFVDGPLVNLGSDFGLMPSLFEPSGVVQQEYFVAGTPVIAFKTGGLKDTVFEYNLTDETGNGFTFEAHRHTDYVQAVHRAFNIFSNSHHYSKIRQRSRESVLDMSVVAEAWAKEFSRMRRSIWADQNLVENYSEQLKLNSNLSIKDSN